jgi:poly(A) polymerase
VSTTPVQREIQRAVFQAGAEGPTVALFRDEPRAFLEMAQLVAERGERPAAWVADQARPYAARLAEISPAERRVGLDGILMGKAPDVGLEWLQRAGGVSVVLPELEATVNFSQEAVGKHKDVWRHTLQVVKQAVPRLKVRWGALLHDIGKVPTRVILPTGEVHFHRHAEVGATMFDRLRRRFDFGDELGGSVRFLILHHLRANQYDGSWTDSAVRRFARECLSRADITTKRLERRKKGHEQIHELSGRISTLKEEDERPVPLPKGLGNAIMERFGVPPSKLIGELRDRCEAAVEGGLLEGGKDCDYYLEFLAAHAGDLLRNEGEGC